MIDLYTYGTSNGQRASVMLEECGLAYRAHKIDIEKGEQHSASFLKLNPLGMIPVLVDSEGPGGTLAVSQSWAIILYLAEKTGKLLPKQGADRALAHQWLMNVASDIGPGSGVVYYVGSVVPEKVASTTKFFEDRLIQQFRNCDRRLGEAEHLAGDLSVADIALYPTVAVRKSLIDKAGGLGNLDRWAAAMAARPGVQRGMKVPG